MQVVKKRAESKFRWAILFLTCIMMIGNYYCYDIPAALNSQMDDYMGKPSDFETLFSLLYTVYSVPNIILPFFGGYFVDLWGVRICLLVFACLITAGQVIFALGLSLKSWPIMFIGRTVFGFGGENLGVANSAILSIWFEGKELAFAFGLNLSVARLGSVINNLVSPALANSAGIEFALWFGVILCGSSIAAVVLVASVDKHVELSIADKGAHTLLVNEDDEEEIVLAKSKEAKTKELRDTLLTNTPDGVEGSRASSEKTEEPQKIQLKDVWSFTQVFWILALICVVVYGCVLPFNNIASALLLERDYFMEPPDGCHLQNDHACQNTVDNTPQDCPSSKWYQPPLQYNVTADDVDCTESYWSDDCTVEFCDRFADAQVQAGTIMSIPYIISACLSPLLGGVVDRYGKRAIIATVAPLVLVVVHCFLGFTDVSPVGPLIGQGLAYSGFAAVLWPSVALVVEQRLVGLGYGIVVSIQNFGLAVFPLIIAMIYSDNGDQYIPSDEIFFVILAWIGVIIGLYLNYYDFYYLDSKLNWPKRVIPEVEELRRQSRESMERHRPMLNPIHNDEKVKMFNEEDVVAEGEEDKRKSSEIYATSMIH